MMGMLACGEPREESIDGQRRHTYVGKGSQEPEYGFEETDMEDQLRGEEDEEDYAVQVGDLTEDHANALSSIVLSFYSTLQRWK